MFGSGFKKVYSLCEEADIKVSYDLDPYGFSFLFHRNLGDIHQNDLPSKKGSDWMSDIDKSVLSLIEENPSISSNEMSEKLGCSPRTVQRSFLSLKKQDKIKRKGTIRRGYWQIVG